MNHLEHILFAYDGTEHAHRAAPHIADLARRSHATVHVVKAVVPHRQASARLADEFPLTSEQLNGWFEGTGPAGAGDLSVRETEDDVELRVEEAQVIRKEELQVGGVTVVQAEVQASSRSLAILDYAQQEDVDLIALSTHGRSGVERVLAGSVAETIVRLAGRAAFVVGPKVPEERAPVVERVLAPIAFSMASHRALAWAAHLAALYDAELHLLHVIEQARLPSVYGVEPVPENTEEIAERVRGALEELSAQAVDQDVAVQIFVEDGDEPEDEILSFAERTETDLIVMSTHGRTGLKRLLVGSVTEDVLRSSPCPVLAVHPE